MPVARLSWHRIERKNIKCGKRSYECKGQFRQLMVAHCFLEALHFVAEVQNLLNDQQELVQQQAISKFQEKHNLLFDHPGF